jgi:hypothetical protein
MFLFLLIFYSMPPPLPPLAQALKDTPGILMKNLKESQGWNSRTDKKIFYTRHDYYFFNLPCSAVTLLMWYI